MARKLKPEKVATINRHSMHAHELCGDWHCEKLAVVLLDGKALLTTCGQVQNLKKVST